MAFFSVDLINFGQLWGTCNTLTLKPILTSFKNESYTVFQDNTSSGILKSSTNLSRSVVDEASTFNRRNNLCIKKSPL